MGGPEKEEAKPDTPVERARTPGPTAAVVLVALVVAVGLGIALLPSLRMSASYASMAEAYGAGTVERGWMPRGIPAETADVREWHDLDTNIGGATATFGGTVPPSWQPIPNTVEVEVPAVLLSSWPAELTGRLTGRSAADAGFQLFCLSGEQPGAWFLVAHHRDSRRLAFWGTDQSCGAVQGAAPTDGALEERTSPGVEPVISSIRFEGAVAIPEAELRPRIGSTIGEHYSGQRADYDALFLTSIYFDRGMINATARAEPSSAGGDGGTANSVDLVFRISEGEVFRVGSIHLTGLELGPEQEVLAALGARRSQVYSRTALGRDVGLLKARAASKGLQVEVGISAAVNAAARTVDLTLSIEQARD